MKVADFREWAKYHRESRSFHTLLVQERCRTEAERIGVEVSLGGASKKADIIDVISDHLEKHGTAKKTKTG